MNTLILFAGSQRRCGLPVWVAGVAFVIGAAGPQLADGAESTMRVLGSRTNAKPAIAEAIPERESAARRDATQRESTIRVATATGSVLGRQESKLVEQRTSAPAAQDDVFTKAMREAAALRAAVTATTPANVQSGEKNTHRTAPPANISALTIAKPTAAPAVSAAPPAAIAPAPTAIATVPLIRITTPTVSESQADEPAPAPIAAAPAPAVRAAAPFVPASSPVVRAPAPLVLAPSTVVRAPAPEAPTAPEVVKAPAKLVEEPLHIARAQPPAIQIPQTAVSKMPAAASTAPTVVSVPAAHATYHPHSEPAPPANDAVVPDTCLTEGGHEVYDVSAELGCVYGPGQSGTQHICGVDCGVHGAPCHAGWDSAHCIPWSLFGPGEYVGPSRTEHVSTYYLRVNDQLTLTYINSRQKLGERYRLGIGDRLLIESSVDESLRREVIIQPDGEITLPIVGEVMAAGKTVKELREDLINVFKEAERQPQITVTPLEINSGLQEIIKAVTSQLSPNGQALDLKVTPEGTIQVPGIGSVYVQGLTLEELRSELEARYTATFGSGLMISPALAERATTYVFVGGEVKTPGRYTLEGPTTATQAIALASGWNIGANLHQIVVFRRDENWCLKAIKIDLRAPLYGNDPCPVNDVWLRDNDLVIIPKSKILCATDVINLYMTRGVWAAFPVTFFQDLSQGSSIGAVVAP